MSERFTRLYSLEQNQYVSASPVIIEAGALLKDNETGNVLAQIKFRSVSEKVIKSISVALKLFDNAGRELSEVAEHTYLDIKLILGGVTGHKKAIILSDSSTRAYKVYVKEIVFSDNSIWNGENVIYEPLPEKKTLAKYLGVELAKFYTKEVGEPAKYVPQKVHDLWLCTCGEYNKNKECNDCDKTYADCIALLDKKVLQEKLNKKRDAKLYKKALKRFESSTASEVKEAIELFKAHPEWKDSEKYINDAEEKLIKIKKRNKVVAISIASAVVILIIIWLLITVSTTVKENKYKEELYKNAMELIVSETIRKR